MNWTCAVEQQPSTDAPHNLGVQLAEDGQMSAARRYIEQFVRTATRPALREGHRPTVCRLTVHDKLNRRDRRSQKRVFSAVSAISAVSSDRVADLPYPPSDVTMLASR